MGHVKVHDICVFLQTDQQTDHAYQLKIGETGVGTLAVRVISKYIGQKHKQT